jgi:hypothetical protein
MTFTCPLALFDGLCSVMSCCSFHSNPTPSLTPSLSLSLSLSLSHSQSIDRSFVCLLSLFDRLLLIITEAKEASKDKQGQARATNRFVDTIVVLGPPSPSSFLRLTLLDSFSDPNLCQVRTTQKQTKPKPQALAEKAFVRLSAKFVLHSTLSLALDFECKLSACSGNTDHSDPGRQRSKGRLLFTCQPQLTRFVPNRRLNSSFFIDRVTFHASTR